MRVESSVSKLGDSPAAKQMWEAMKKHWRQVGRDEADVGGGKRRRLADGVDSRNAKGAAVVRDAIDPSSTSDGGGVAGTRPAPSSIAPSGLDGVFDASLAMLRRHRAGHGDLLFAEGSRDRSLEEFCAQVRYARMHPGRSWISLSRERVEALDGLGFVWAQVYFHDELHDPSDNRARGRVFGSIVHHLLKNNGYLFGGKTLNIARHIELELYETMSDIKTYSDHATLSSRIEAARSHLMEEHSSQLLEAWKNSSKCCLVEDSDEGWQTSSDDEPIDLACETPPPTPPGDDWSSASAES